MHFCVCDRAGTDISEIGINQAKKDKNEHQFARLSTLVPQVWKLAETAPELWILEDQVNTCPWSSQVTKFSPWVKDLKKLQKWSLKFQIWQKWSLKFQTWKKSKEVLVLFKLGKFHPCKYFGKAPCSAPQI
jgi:hypothetical protein